MGRFSLSFILLFCFCTVFGQNITITGVITDELGETLIGVNLFDAKKSKGAVTDIDGKFILKTEIGNQIKVSYIGYKDYFFTADADNKSLKIKLEPNVSTLNQVVISASRRKEKILDAPASISTISSEQIENRVAIAPPDILKNTTGVDIMQTGLQSANIVVRGFNSPFNTSLLTMSDNRITRVPSLKINVMQLIPATSDDIERVEVLRGAASALYGPNSSDGVIHFITKSPIDQQQTKLSLGVGLRSKIDGPVLDSGNANSDLFDNEKVTERMMFQTSFYHAQKITKGGKNFQAGYKLSANYFTGYDWQYKDPFEADTIIMGNQTFEGRVEYLTDGTVIPADSVAAGVRGDFVDNRRDPQIDKISFDGRFDMRFGKETELIFSGGLTNINNIELAPLGSIQGINWKNWYTQTRFIHKDLFAQFYINGNNAGDSYFLRTGDVNKDRSKSMAAQVQHSIEPTARFKLIYGADAFLTRPDTRNTINGRFEEDDNVNEYGIYVHGDYKFNEHLTAIGALRLDHHSVVGGVFFSPRAAVLYKLNPKNTVRLTFNRAFRTPGTGGFFADALSATLPTGIDVRVIGNVEGFGFSYGENPYFENRVLPQFASPYTTENGAYLNVGDQSVNDAAWNDILNVTVDEFANIFANNDAGVNVEAIATIVKNLLPDSLENVGHDVKALNLTTRRFVDTEWENLGNVIPLKNVETLTYEIGYKGILADFLFLQADAYYTQMKDYIAPTTLITPNVVLNTDDLLAYLEPSIGPLIESLDNFDNFVNALDGNPVVNGVQNGTVRDEIENALIDAAGNLPIGTISPTNVDGATMILATRNIGDLSVWGFDIDASAYLSKNIKISAAYSFVNKDRFEVPEAQFGYVALNAPQHRTRFGFNYNIKQIGLNVGTGFRWQSAFPANSGVFVGEVDSFHDMDLNLSWTPNFHDNLSFTLSVSNLYNNRHQFFVGSPEIGTSGMFRISYAL